MDASRESVGSTNDVIDVSRLPRIDVADFVPLDPRYRRLRSMTAGAVAIVALAAALGVNTMTPSLVTAIVSGVLLLLVAVGCVVHRLEVDRMGYLVREQDVSFRSGLVSRSVATAPFARVQHVSIGRGPLDRQFGLATLSVRTAGGSITVPGLDIGLAERLKQQIADRASTLADAEVDPDRRAEAPPAASASSLPPPVVPAAHDRILDDG